MRRGDQPRPQPGSKVMGTLKGEFHGKEFVATMNDDHCWHSDDRLITFMLNRRFETPILSSTTVECRNALFAAAKALSGSVTLPDGKRVDGKELD